MFATHLARPVFAITSVLRIFAPTDKTPSGPLPTWLNDPQLSAQLYRDTGLSPEDLSGRPTHDATLPFFMQKNFW